MQLYLLLQLFLIVILALNLNLEVGDFLKQNQLKKIQNNSMSEIRLGILGGGQLGSMLSVAAKKLII